MSTVPRESIGEVDYLHDIVELQRSELTRLLRENKRLNDRIDELVKLQHRDQTLRQQLQEALDRLATTTPLPATNGAYTAELEARMRQTETRFNALRQGVAKLVSSLPPDLAVQAARAARAAHAPDNNGS